SSARASSGARGGGVGFGTCWRVRRAEAAPLRARHLLAGYLACHWGVTERSTGQVCVLTRGLASGSPGREPGDRSLGLASARRTRYPGAWRVSCPCIARETPSTPCSIR